MIVLPFEPFTADSKLPSVRQLDLKIITAEPVLSSRTTSHEPATTGSSIVRVLVVIAAFFDSGEAICIYS